MDPEKVEYELQHFNFCSDDMIAENRQLVKHLIQSTFYSFTQEFVKKHKVPEEDAREMLANCHQTSLKIFEESGPKLDEVSQLYKSTFSIPDSILLPSDLLHRKEQTAEQLESLQSQVRQLEHQIQQDGVFLSMLEEELKLHGRLAPCFEDEENLMDLVERHRQLEIVPAEDTAVVQDLAEVMKDVMRMK